MFCRLLSGRQLRDLPWSGIGPPSWLFPPRHNHVDQGAGERAHDRQQCEDEIHDLLGKARLWGRFTGRLAGGVAPVVLTNIFATAVPTVPVFPVAVTGILDRVGHDRVPGEVRRVDQDLPPAPPDPGRRRH